KTAHYRVLKTIGRKAGTLAPLRESFSQLFTRFPSHFPKKTILRKVLTPYIHLDTSDIGESRGPPISRNCEKDRDAFAGPVFGRLSRPVLRGDYHSRQSHCSLAGQRWCAGRYSESHNNLEKHRHRSRC